MSFLESIFGAIGDDTTAEDSVSIPAIVRGALRTARLEETVLGNAEFRLRYEKSAAA
jgi:hypothetical protein